MRIPSLLAAPILALAAAPAVAGDAGEAADTAEVYIYAKEAGNEALLEHLSDPDRYDEMAAGRRTADAPRRENIEIEAIEVEQVDDAHAVARTRYRPKHGGPSAREEVHLIQRDGRWQVTAPPATDEAP